MQNSTEQNTVHLILIGWAWPSKSDESINPLSFLKKRLKKVTSAPLDFLRRQVNHIEVNSPEFARRLCRLIPSQCPFERDVKLFGRTLFHIPPMCKLNPLYDELMGLRFRALCYLADECGEDISAYC